MLLQKGSLPFLFLVCSSLDLLEPRRVLASVVLVRWATFRVSTRSTLTIFTVSICAHTHARVRDELVDDVALHTYVHTYVSTGDFLVCMIYVGLASACPNNKFRTTNINVDQLSPDSMFGYSRVWPASLYPFKYIGILFTSLLLIIYLKLQQHEWIL